MFKLNSSIELKEVIRTSSDVEQAFKRRGYKFNTCIIKSGYRINASIINFENDEIRYEFSAKSIRKCYLQAAMFLKQVQSLHEEYGLDY